MPSPQKTKQLNRALFILSAILSIGSWGGAPVAQANEKPHYYDISLTGERICKRCTAEWGNAREIRLTNKNGETTLVKPYEILGVNRHPVWRKLTMKSLQGIGLPGPIIVPAAFEDGNDYTCKYCKELGL